MKKWVALLLCVAMLLVFAGCSLDEDVRGTLGGGDNSAANSEPQEESAFEFGTTKGGTYENAFIGLGCTLDSAWTYKSDAEIKELNQLAKDVMGDELAEQIENASILYDMAAIHSNQMDNINVNLEKGTLMQVAATDLKKMFEQSIPQVETAFANMGYTDYKWEVCDVTIDGKTFAAMKGIAKINGVPMYQISFAKKCGKYIASVAITTFSEDKTQAILDAFYVID